jgi:uncharacterized protein YecT (DUF1311 family)
MTFRPVFFILIFFFAFSGTSAQVQDNKKTHLIDQKLEDCLGTDTNQTTLGMMECTAAAKAEWDAELNKYYKLLMQVLPAKQKEKLKQAQRQWLAYRDKESDFSGTMFYSLDGSMWKISAASREYNITKTRAIELIDYYNSFLEGK